MDVWEIKVDVRIYNCFLAGKYILPSFIYIGVEKKWNIFFMQLPVFLEELSGEWALCKYSRNIIIGLFDPIHK